MEIVYVCAFVCVCVGLIGGFQMQEHSSGTEDPVLAAPHQRVHVLRHTHTHTPHLVLWPNLTEEGNECSSVTANRLTCYVLLSVCARVVSGTS